MATGGVNPAGLVAGVGDGLIPEVEDAAPWLRLEREGLAEYALFQRYLALGERRSVGRLVEAEAALGDGEMHPHEARRRVRWAATRWRWAERAAAYDSYVAAEDVADMRRGRLEMRRRRRAALEKLAEVLEAKVEKLAEKDAGVGEVVDALRLMMEQSRKEYDDTPVERQMERMRPGSRPIMAGELTALMVRLQVEAQGMLVQGGEDES